MSSNIFHHPGRQALLRSVLPTRYAQLAPVGVHWGGYPPARETVAGLALLRFSGSNMAFMADDMRMRSPLANVSTC